MKFETKKVSVVCRVCYYRSDRLHFAVGLIACYYRNDRLHCIGVDCMLLQEQQMSLGLIVFIFDRLYDYQGIFIVYLNPIFSVEYVQKSMSASALCFFQSGHTISEKQPLIIM